MLPIVQATRQDLIIFVRVQREELGVALRAEKEGVQARLMLDMHKVTEELAATKSALEVVRLAKEDVDTTLSIVHADFDRALEQGIISDAILITRGIAKF